MYALRRGESGPFLPQFDTQLENLVVQLAATRGATATHRRSAIRRRQ